MVVRSVAIDPKGGNTTTAFAQVRSRSERSGARTPGEERAHPNSAVEAAAKKAKRMRVPTLTPVIPAIP